MLHHQMPGHHTAQTTRAARHQNRTPSHIPDNTIPTTPGHHPRQTRHQHLTTTHHHLGLGLTHRQSSTQQP
ncbi:hypothetical protein, partial [Streptomyces sp. AVP053U2]|uniref:hypothetical protein n=1 Tax=Streptomyces sp. AVP053U2 TaxID=1737066 RepID=UPI0035204E8E